MVRGKFPPSGGAGRGIRNFIGGGGGFFYAVKGTWGRVILKTRTFLKAKNSFLWITTERQLKSKLTWPKCPKSAYEIKTKMEQEQWRQQWLFCRGDFSRWGGEWANFWLVGETPPFEKLQEKYLRARSLQGKSCCVYIYYSKAKAFLESFSESGFKFLKPLFYNF